MLGNARAMSDGEDPPERDEERESAGDTDVAASVEPDRVVVVVVASDEDGVRNVDDDDAVEGDREWAAG